MSTSANLAIALLSTLTLCAQPPDFYSSKDFMENWKISKSFTIAVAEAMPEEHFWFKPTKEEMSFGVLMAHIAGSQVFRFEQVSGRKSNNAPLPKVATRADVLRYLRQSFDFCIETLATLDAKRLDASYQVDWEGRPRATGRQVLMNMFVHTAHHRAQAEVYLRLKGVVPPKYTF
ncbi:MAG: DinB family protein [Acidobacteria bacterium]|nr:DinB family protein [Acidobacteriota bacterium]